MPPLDVDETFLANARQALLAEQTAAGFWVGELSNSALSTATALFTLSLLKRALPAVGDEDAERIRSGLSWLAEHQNADGGWGDTTKSLSNISTTALCWACLSIPEASDHADATDKVEAWLTAQAGSLQPGDLARAIIRRYGKDKTFSVPILTMLALADRLGPRGWKYVPQLPFELAACPFQWFQWLQLPVVSYALPALIAIGQVRHHHRPSWNPLARLIRRTLHKRTSRVLRTIQPTTGGYLEATPLTSFVSMSLIGSGQAGSEVVKEGVRFLRDSQQADGSWPIDTNLTTWVTTLSVNALSTAVPESEAIARWLMSQQYRTVHPYTHAAPGGWAWTDLSGGVPDADDTSGALVALKTLQNNQELDRETLEASVTAGLNWLLDLQNRDGGIPTFCRGWTGLPFDRSSADITAHAMLAWAAWRCDASHPMRQRIDTAWDNAQRFLIKIQQPDGSWAPLWFGNQFSDVVENLTYGTSRVLRLAGVTDWTDSPAWMESLVRGTQALLNLQNSDHGWGGRTGTPSSLEETALAVEGLASLLAAVHVNVDLAELVKPERLERTRAAVASGINYLRQATDNGTRFDPNPIGFYFANLWYFEKLYPLIYTNAALTAARRVERLSR